MQSIFEKLLDNLIIAALVPSLVFFTILILLFGDMVPLSLVEKLRLIFETRAIMIITLAACNSFVLSYLSETIYWFYRGEFVSKTFYYPEKSRAKKLQTQIEDLTDKLDKLSQVVKEKDPTFIQMANEKKILVDRYQKNYPPLHGVTPTRFGNILAAAEYYPLICFGMNNARQMWVRLEQVIPTENMNKIEQVNHQMAFLINSSLLSFILCGFSFISAISQFLFFSITLIQKIFSPGVTSNTVGFIGPGLFYSLMGTVFLALGGGFYWLSLSLTKRYADMYRSAFDLYRFQLSEQLRFGCPSSPISERAHWDKIDQFLNSEAGGKPIKLLSYVHPGSPAAKEEFAETGLIVEDVSAEELNLASNEQ